MPKKKKNYIGKATGNLAGSMLGIPIVYNIAGKVPSNASSAVDKALKSSAPVFTMMPMAGTLQVTEGLLGELEGLGKPKKKKR